MCGEGSKLSGGRQAGASAQAAHGLTLMQNMQKRVEDTGDS